jgi:hypothetical protein
MRKRGLLIASLLVAAGALLLVWQRARPSGDDRAKAQELPEGLSEEAAEGRRQAGVARRALPPRPLRDRPPGLELDPSSPNYDPRRLYREEDVSPLDVVLAEPRNPAWAEPLEQELRNQLAADLAAVLPEAEISEIECRSSSCRIGIIAPEGGMDALTGPFPVAALAEIAALSFGEPADGWVYFEWGLLFGPDQRDLGGWTRWYPEFRNRILRDMQARGQELPGGIEPPP